MKQESRAASAACKLCLSAHLNEPEPHKHVLSLHAHSAILRLARASFGNLDVSSPKSHEPPTNNSQDEASKQFEDCITGGLRVSACGLFEGIMCGSKQHFAWRHKGGEEE